MRYVSYFIFYIWTECNENIPIFEDLANNRVTLAVGAQISFTRTHDSSNWQRSGDYPGSSTQSLPGRHYVWSGEVGKSLLCVSNGINITVNQQISSAQADTASGNTGCLTLVCRENGNSKTLTKKLTKHTFWTFEVKTVTWRHARLLCQNSVPGGGHRQICNK